MNLDLYDKLILRQQDEVNKQRHIVLMNIRPDLFETHVNYTKHTPNSVRINQGISLWTRKFLAIEPTSDREVLGQNMLIVSNKDYPHTSKKLVKLLAYLTRKKIHSQQWYQV